MQIETPLVRTKVGETVINGLVTAEIESVGFYAADQFKFLFAIGDNPVFGLAYYSSLGLQTISIEISVLGGGFFKVFTGQIDNILVDIRQRTATISGRDFSARMIDKDLSDIFLNLTSSQIAETIAERHQLACDVVATSTPVGQYYEIDHARTALFHHSQFSTEWNLLVGLAKIEGYFLSVTGNTLNFRPPVNSSPLAISVSGFSELAFDLATSLPASVNVKSWSTKNKAVVSGTAGAGAGATIVRPNLSTSQAQNAASNHLANIRQQQTVLTGRMPGELTLAVGNQILMTGTESQLDQLYTVYSIMRRIDANEGFVQQIRAYAEV